MMADLADAVDILMDLKVHEQLSVVVLKGTGGWFCGGADLKVAQQEMTSPEGGCNESLDDRYADETPTSAANYCRVR